VAGRRHQNAGQDAPRRYTSALPMDRKLARRNIRTGLITAAIMIFMFAITFVAAFVYTQ
jgi:hypothetical protein